MKRFHSRSSTLGLLLLISSGSLKAASDVSVSGGATSGGTFSGGNPNVFTPTAAATNVQGSAITASLNAGNAVVLNTASAAAGNGDIIAASTILTKIAGSSSQLTLNAVRDLSLGSISSSADSIPLSLNAGRNITNADVLKTLNGNVTINCGQTFTLGNSLLAGTGQILLQSGTVESHALTVTASSVQVSAGAAWKQRGTLAGSLNVAGTLSAGSAIGALAVSGTTTLQSTATTVVNIGGTTHSTGYDRIATTGAVSLAGNLQISFFSQYGNNFGDSIINSNSFTFLTGGSITGTFTGLPNNSRVTLPDDFGSLKITYTATAVTLSDWQPIVRDLTWDPGATEAGTEILNQTNTRSGRHYFRINTQSTDIGAWRSRLTVNSGQADLYFFNGTLPQTLTGYTTAPSRLVAMASSSAVINTPQARHGIWSSVPPPAPSGHWFPAVPGCMTSVASHGPIAIPTAPTTSANPRCPPAEAPASHRKAFASSKPPSLLELRRGVSGSMSAPATSPCGRVSSRSTAPLATTIASSPAKCSSWLPTSRAIPAPTSSASREIPARP